MRLNGKHLLHRLIWIEGLCSALLIVFIFVDDEYLIPKFIPNRFPWSPNAVAGVLDSIWVVCLMLLAFYIQIKYMHKIRLLEGILSVCASCKKIRDGKEEGKDLWSPIEEYIQKRSHADFSHTICPECGIRLYGDLYLKAVGQARGGS